MQFFYCVWLAAMSLTWFVLQVMSAVACGLLFGYALWGMMKSLAK